MFCLFLLTFVEVYRRRIVITKNIFQVCHEIIIYTSFRIKNGGHNLFLFEPRYSKLRSEMSVYFLSFSHSLPLSLTGSVSERNPSALCTIVSSSSVRSLKQLSVAALSGYL